MFPNPNNSPIKKPIQEPPQQLPCQEQLQQHLHHQQPQELTHQKPHEISPLTPSMCPFLLLHSPLSLHLNSFYITHPGLRRLSPKDFKSRRRTKSVSPVENKDLFQTAVDLCSTKLEAIADFQLRKKFKPLHDLEKIKNKKVSNPFNFRGVPMVTTFRSVGSQTQGVCDFPNKASQTDAVVRLAELEHPSLKKMFSFCAGRVPIYVHPSFYSLLKVRYPMDVGGVSRDGRVTAELGTGSLRQAVGILTPEDFRIIVDSE